MTENNGTTQVRDPIVFNRNRSDFPPEELAQYGDQWVAWNLDGTRIVAHDPDLQKVAAAMDSLGLDPEKTVLEWVPIEGEMGTQL